MVARKDTLAVLIEGDDIQCSHDCIDQMYSYLRREAGLQHVYRLYGSRYSNRQIFKYARSIITSHLRNHPDAPVVMHYNGHGNRGYIDPSSGLPISYWSIAGLLKQSPFIFINDTCYAGSCIPFFKLRGLHKKGLIITSQNSTDISMGDNFQIWLLRSLRANKPFFEKIVPHHICIGEMHIELAPIRYADDGTPIIDFGTTKMITYDHPIYEGPCHYPQRVGLPLDDLLYAR